MTKCMVDVSSMTGPAWPAHEIIDPTTLRREELLHYTNGDHTFFNWVRYQQTNAFSLRLSSPSEVAYWKDLEVKLKKSWAHHSLSTADAGIEEKNPIFPAWADHGDHTYVAMCLAMPDKYGLVDYGVCRKFPEFLRVHIGLLNGISGEVVRMDWSEDLWTLLRIPKGDVEVGVYELRIVEEVVRDGSPASTSAGSGSLDDFEGPDSP
ncbi:hypothetical protein MKZ38_005762 [Zalerion maritima]|uniref:Uncharacterized protein n=1 Tax=Zalerion maritima TaxID=339359 RepID=A0AAD5WNT3_9PEZI|nr:hypothetical protein MKZ38_005762 [Zalerion maritima]